MGALKSDAPTLAEVNRRIKVGSAWMVVRVAAAAVLGAWPVCQFLAAHPIYIGHIEGDLVEPAAVVSIAALFYGVFGGLGALRELFALAAVQQQLFDAMNWRSQTQGSTHYPRRRHWNAAASTGASAVQRLLVKEFGLAERPSRSQQQLALWIKVLTVLFQVGLYYFLRLAPVPNQARVIVLMALPFIATVSVLLYYVKRLHGARGVERAAAMPSPAHSDAPS